MNIKGKIAVIGGGASGMGAATAAHLAHLGAKVVILDIDNKNNQNQGHMTHISCDISDCDDVEAAFSTIKKTLGTPRICVNCAGIVAGQRIVSKDHHPMALDDFAEIIRVNLIGTFNVLRVAAAHMSIASPLSKTGERGVIINTASIAAYEGQMGQAAYAASKGGVVSLTLPAARELAQNGIRVMTIAPGLIETPMLEALPEKVKEALLSKVPFPKRFGQASEFAMLVKHIIRNPLLNGEVIRLDAGLRM